MFSRQFALDTLERAIKTFAQALVAVLAVGTTVFDVDWLGAVGTASLAAVISVLTSVGSSAAGDHNSAALVTTGQHRRKP